MPYSQTFNLRKICALPVAPQPKDPHFAAAQTLCLEVIAFLNHFTPNQTTKIHKETNRFFPPSILFQPIKDKLRAAVHALANSAEPACAKQKQDEKFEEFKGILPEIVAACKAFLKSIPKKKAKGEYDDITENKERHAEDILLYCQSTVAALTAFGIPKKAYQSLTEMPLQPHFRDWILLASTAVTSLSVPHGEGKVFLSPPQRDLLSLLQDKFATVERTTLPALFDQLEPQDLDLLFKLDKALSGTPLFPALRVVIKKLAAAFCLECFVKGNRPELASKDAEDMVVYPAILEVLDLNQSSKDPFTQTVLNRLRGLVPDSIGKLETLCREKGTSEDNSDATRTAMELIEFQ